MALFGSNLSSEALCLQLKKGYSFWTAIQEHLSVQ